MKQSKAKPPELRPSLVNAMIIYDKWIEEWKAGLRERNQKNGSSKSSLSEKVESLRTPIPVFVDKGSDKSEQTDSTTKDERKNNNPNGISDNNAEV